jgi:hypothetical protein
VYCWNRNNAEPREELGKMERACELGMKRYDGESRRNAKIYRVIKLKQNFSLSNRLLNFV